MNLFETLSAARELGGVLVERNEQTNDVALAEDLIFRPQNIKADSKGRTIEH